MTLSKIVRVRVINQSNKSAGNRSGVYAVLGLGGQVGGRRVCAYLQSKLERKKGGIQLNRRIQNAMFLKAPRNRKAMFTRESTSGGGRPGPFSWMVRLEREAFPYQRQRAKRESRLRNKTVNSANRALPSAI